MSAIDLVRLINPMLEPKSCGTVSECSEMHQIR